MDLALWIGLGAFVILAIMLVLLWHSQRRDAYDPVTQEIIIKAHTGSTVIVDATQESED